MSNLKRVLQAIEIGSPKEWVGVLWGEKTVSIREGNRDYVEERVMLMSPNGSQSVEADIIRSRRILAGEVNAEELAGDWYKSIPHMIEDMGGWYPGFNEDTKVTVPMWDNVRGEIVPTERPEKLRIYLSHPSTIREQVRKWELDFKKRYAHDIEIINPLAEEYNIIPIDGKDTQLEREAKVAKDSKKIVRHEERLLLDCHANITVHSGDWTVGGPQEQYRSYRTLWKPTYSLVLNGRENAPWIRENSDRVFTDWDKLEEFISELHLQGMNYFYRGKFLDVDRGDRLRKG